MRDPRGGGGGDPWIDFPSRKKSGEAVGRKERRGPIFLQTRWGIRRTFCDGLVELAHCRSESRTCLMELEPFWKFDRREQPASRSSVPPLCSPAIVFFHSYSLFFSAYFETELFLLLSHSTPDSSCFSNFDLIPCPPVLFLSFVLDATIESCDLKKSLHI